VPTRTRVAFGVGATAETLALYSVGALGMVFYNQVLGLDVLLAGLVPTLAIFADALSDPFMGSFSDRFRNKRWGRRHPFMFIAPVPIAVSFYAIFNPPDALAHWSLFGWFLGWSIALRTFMTIFHVPHLAMGSELSTAYTERTKIMAYNSFFSWMGGAALFKVNTVLFFATVATAANGLLNADAYPGFAAAMAIVIVCVLFASAWFTRDRIPTLPQPPADQPPFSIRGFLRDVVTAFSNRNYLFLMIAYFCLSLMLGVRSGLGTYMNIFYWELPSERIGTLVFAGSVVGYLTAFLVSTRLHTFYDKRNTIVAGAALLSIFPAMPVVLRMAGVFPENGSDWLLWSIAGFNALGAASGAILNISVMSAIGDIADENELRHGIRQEGILYSARTFFAKVDNSIGHGIAAVSLSMIGFPDQAKPGAVAADTLHLLGFIDSPLMIVPGLVAAYFYSKYRIDRHRYERTRAELAARHAAAADGHAQAAARGDGAPTGQAGAAATDAAMPAPRPTPS
jgi:Na+/melibiose symporter-like transporter